MAKNNNFAISQIFEINGILEKLPKEFNNAKNALMESNYNKYARLFVNATLDLERATMKARSVGNTIFKQNNMPYEYKKMIKSIADDVQKIDVKVEGKITKITLPNTLPHYKNNFKSILVEPLNLKLKDYQKHIGKFPKYDKVVFVIINIVSDQHNKKTIRDNDNYDYKQVINQIAYWLLNDDGYEYCSMLNTTKIGEKDRTEIYAVPFNEFNDWFQKNLN